jgi:hypothetical protein
MEAMPTGTSRAAAVKLAVEEKHINRHRDEFPLTLQKSPLTRRGLVSGRGRWGIP